MYEDDLGVKITYKGETGQAWIKDETDELMVTWDSDLSVSKLPDDDVTMIE